MYVNKEMMNHLYLRYWLLLYRLWLNGAKEGGDWVEEEDEDGEEAEDEGPAHRPYLEVGGGYYNKVDGGVATRRMGGTGH